MNDLDLLEPIKLFRNLKETHNASTEAYFDSLLKESNIDVEVNRELVKKYKKEEANIASLNKKLSSLKVKKAFLIVLIVLGGLSLLVGIISLVASLNQLVGIITVILGPIAVALAIVLLVSKIKPQKKQANELLEKANNLANSIKQEAYQVMAPLNALLDSDAAFTLLNKSIPQLVTDKTFDIKRYEQMKEKYGLEDNLDKDSSSVGVLSGEIYGNPFMIYKTYNTHMVPTVYRGTLVIHWTTTVHTKDGPRVQHHTQTLTATVTKPKPAYFYDTQLVYCNEAAPNLTFTREPVSANGLDEKQVSSYVKKHQKDLDNLAKEALKKNSNYTPLGNPKFELLFGGTNRNNEVEYRLLFTPLSQQSMLELLASNEGFGDDFTFRKKHCINIIRSAHAQAADYFAESNYFSGFDYDAVRKNFIDYNNRFLKSIFFDFAPLFSIPLYTQHKAREYIYKDTIKSNYSSYEHEVIANQFNAHDFAHEDTKTNVILKTNFIGKQGTTDRVGVTAYSYDEIERLTLVPVLGGDGRMHNVPVTWYEYPALEAQGEIQITSFDGSKKDYQLGISQTNLEIDKIQDNIIYKRGFISVNSSMNTDINTLKAKMLKK